MPAVKVPATSANLGPGFDCLGMALQLYNEVEFEIRPSGLTIETVLGDDEHIAHNERNLIYRAVKHGLQAVGLGVPGLLLRQKNAIPRTRGLGSSAACVVAGLCIANNISGGQITRRRLIELAAEMEGHPDNVLPAILGGFTVGCVEEGHVYHARIEPPERLRCCVMVPPFTVSTRRARKALPDQVSLDDAVYNISRAALLAAAMAQGDLSLLSVALGDRLHQAYRAEMIPRYQRTIEFARDHGALGCFISGSGSTLIALLDGDYDAFCEAMRAFQAGFDWRIELVRPCLQGARMVL